MKPTCETIAVEGGAEGRTPQELHLADERLYDLFHRVVRHIPRTHRIGWYHALARYAGQPFTSQPTPRELAYLAWSAQRRTPPRAAA